MERVSLDVNPINGTASIFVETDIVKDGESKTKFVYERYDEDYAEAFKIARTLCDFLESAHKNDLFFYEQRPPESPILED